MKVEFSYVKKFVASCTNHQIQLFSFLFIAYDCYGLELGDRNVYVLILLRVTFVLLVLYFNPMLPIALWRLRGPGSRKVT